MSKDKEDIIVSVQRIDGGANLGGWAARATYINRTTGATRTLTDADFKSTLKSLGSEDKVTIEIEHNGDTIPIVIAKLQGRDVAKAFDNYLSLITSTLDGSLSTAVSAITNNTQRLKLQTYVNELKSDLESIASEGRYIEITANSNLGNGTYGQYKGRTTVGSIDINGDGVVDSRHVIEVNTSLIGSGRSERLDTTLIHEMFHILEGEGNPDVDFARFGLNESNHSNEFDKVAIKLIKLADGKDLSIGSSLSTSNIVALEGGSSNDTFSFQAGARGAFIEAGAGDDVISYQFSNSVLDGGAGNDTYNIQSGSGRIAIFDDGGFDVIDFGNEVSREQLAVKLELGWVELGIKPVGATNVTTSDLDQVVVIPNFLNELNQVEAVRIGGQLISLSELALGANSAPFFTNDPEFVVQSTFRGGAVARVGVADIDEDILTTSVVAVDGYASNVPWWISNGQLFNGGTAPTSIRFSTVTLRVTDGQNSTDLVARVRWTPFSNVPTDSPFEEFGQQSGGNPELLQNNMMMANLLPEMIPEIMSAI